MQKGFIFTIAVISGLIFGIANDGFARERYDGGQSSYEYDYDLSRGQRTYEYDRSRREDEYRKMTRNQGGAGRIDKSTVEGVISDWNDKPQEVARNLMKKYGMPDEVTRQRLIWHDNGPWKRTEVVNEEIIHSFPEEHEDILIQTVSYEVPDDKTDDLVKYNECLTVKKTKGELTSQCGSEEMNILALNLADDVVKGKSDARGARSTFEQQATDVMEGKRAPLARDLQFKTNPGSRSQSTYYQDSGKRSYQSRQNSEKTAMTGKGIDKSTVERVTSRWNDASKEVAQKMIDKYGTPDEVTQNRLIWHNNDLWKRTEIINEEIPHHFPKKHDDVVIQTIDYNVPPNKADDLLNFDGSIIIDRTKGELSSRCGKEEMNILTLNLADDIVKGKRSVEDARNVYADQVRATMRGEDAPLVRDLKFDADVRGTADPGKPIMEEEEEEGSFFEKAKEKLGID
jgi:hypothetical protein